MILITVKCLFRGFPMFELVTVCRWLNVSTLSLGRDRSLGCRIRDMLYVTEHVVCVFMVLSGLLDSQTSKLCKVDDLVKSFHNYYCKKIQWQFEYFLTGFESDIKMWTFVIHKSVETLSFFKVSSLYNCVKYLRYS